MQLERHQKTIDVVAAIASILVQSRPLAVMLQDCAEILLQHIDAAFVRIWLHDGVHPQFLVLRSSVGRGLPRDAHLDSEHCRIADNQYHFARIAVERKPILTNDLFSDRGLRDRIWANTERLVAVAGLPLLAGEELTGVMLVFAGHHLSEDDLSLLSAVSRIIATAVVQDLAANKLQRSHDELSAFFENPVVGLHSVDANGRITRINATELSLLGYRLEECVGRHISELHADKNVAQNLLARLANAEVIRDFRAKLLCKDGSTRHVLIDSDAVLVDGKFSYSRCFTRDITESAVAREHLERARQLFRAVFDQTFQFILVLSLDGILLDANQTALSLVGAKLEDVLGQFFWDTPWWADKPQIKDKLQRAVRAAAQGEISRFEVKFTGDSGQEIDVDFTIKPVRDDNGDVVLLIPEGRDITQRKEAEREILEKEARTRAIVDTAPDGIITITTEGIIESANAPMHRLFGYEQGELIGLSIATVVESLSGLRTKVGAVPSTEKGSSGVRWESEGRRKDGVSVPVEVSLSELSLSDGTVFIAIIADISERLRSQGLQAQLAAIVESCEDPIYGKDFTGRITAWNPAAERLFGYSARETIGNSVSMLMPSDRRGELDDLLARVSAGERIQNLETVRVSKEGRLIDVALTISPTLNSAGKVIGISIFARDISLKKAAEKRVSEFYSMVSHELRTPLTSIRASLGLLEGGIAGELPDDAVQLVQIARSESDRLIRLINDILDLRKIEAGKVELRLETVRPAELLRGVNDAMKGIIDEVGVRLVCVNNYNTELRCDKDRIIQVLTNLCSNAVKYSPDNGSITVSVEKAPSPGLVRFCIGDSGPGISEENMHKLFGKFQQIDSSDSRPKGGTGLGLAIVKAIVEQHAGNVGVVSTPGEGATFWFELPTSVYEQPESADGDLLIVEDDRKLSRVLNKLLSSIGYKVRSASTVKDAREQLNAGVPDAILLDITLPDGSGADFMQELWLEPTTASVPIVVLTGKSDYAHQHSPLLIDWMVKPFDKTRLTRALRRAVRRHTGNPLRVLLVEDDQASAAVLRKLIASTGVECRWAPDGKSALNLVRTFNPDMIVLDVGVPPPDGFDLVRILKNEGAHVPLLVYTGRDLDSKEREELTLGMTMHLIKSKVGQDEFLNSMKELLGDLPAPSKPTT